MTAPRASSGRRAFTLVEVIATIVVLSIIGGAASSIVLNSMDGYVDATARAELHTELSVGLDRIVRELRNVPLDDSAADVAPDIDAVTASSVDWDDDSGVALVGTSLELTIAGGSPTVLAADVTAFSVQCYDEAGTALAATLAGAGCDAIRRIGISMTSTRYGVSETLHTRIFVRATMQGAS